MLSSLEKKKKQHLKSYFLSFLIHTLTSQRKGKRWSWCGLEGKILSLSLCLFLLFLSFLFSGFIFHEIGWPINLSL